MGDAVSREEYGLSPEARRKITGVFAAHANIDEVILYGSRAKGDHRSGSDIDLTLKGEGIDLEQLNAISNALDDLLLPCTFDLSIFHHIMNPDLPDHIGRVGRVFLQTRARLTPERLMPWKQEDVA